MGRVSVKRNHKLTIQKKGAVDPFGSEVADWIDVTERWFSLEPLEGEEELQAAQMESRQTHTARCDWFAGASSAMRITDGTRFWNVQSVANEYEQNRFLVWRLVEVV